MAALRQISKPEAPNGNKFKRKTNFSLYLPTLSLKTFLDQLKQQYILKQQSVINLKADFQRAFFKDTEKVKFIYMSSLQFCLHVFRLINW